MDDRAIDAIPRSAWIRSISGWGGFLVWQIGPWKLIGVCIWPRGCWFPGWKLRCKRRSAAKKEG